MADNKGSDSNPHEAKSGPVKPPVLDLKARPAESEAKKADTPAAATTAKPKPAEPAKPSESAKPATPVAPVAAAPARSAPYVAAIGGGVLGLVAAYGLALAGLWPAPPAPTPATDPRVAQLASAVPELKTVTETTQSELSALNQRIASLETAGETAAPAVETNAVDSSALEADIAALTARINALPAAPSASTDTAALDSLRTDLAALGSRIDEVAARVGTAEAGLRTLDTSVTQTSAALASQPSDIGAVLQLPLILSGLETAFANGRPYATELAALRAASPDAAVPTAIANSATTGLARPDAIARRFDAVLPNMLAGRPANPDAQWQDGALDWLASAVALRPTGEIDGDGPDAVMSRLEGAMSRRDFVTANTLITKLPPPMVAAAEDVPALVAAQAEASQFLDDVRARALSREAAQ
ncbi:hypothetical protein WH87_18020 [Devosia epidermidihirudinis]|uniref:Inner membrane protein n=1 Tax=Devosia epidermidihirudinis TaxID=1293439 RepID=A0A0F5Q2D6_9HYPH|nr:hypothetical protein [Devosia epidermidihirudinis]KKC35062.1 hypothetical protein WH87_18020 [Devosia epidermidihirudinis]